MKRPDYRNWVPKPLTLAMFLGACVCGLLSVCANAFLSGSLRRILVILFIFLGILLLLIGTYYFILRRIFDYNGKYQLSKKIIEYTAKHITLPKGGVGLDVGCGSGALSIECARRNPYGIMVGCDIWSGAYTKTFTQELCEENAEAEGVTNIRFTPGNALNLPFEDESFDAVISNYVYHNISGHNKQKLLGETLRVLRKGGIFAIHDLMGKMRYGDMKAFLKELKEEGYEEVHLVPTMRGEIIDSIPATLLGLGDSMLLYGKK